MLQGAVGHCVTRRTSSRFSIELVLHLSFGTYEHGFMVSYRAIHSRAKRTCETLQTQASRSSSRNYSIKVAISDSLAPRKLSHTAYCVDRGPHRRHNLPPLYPRLILVISGECFLVYVACGRSHVFFMLGTAVMSKVIRPKELANRISGAVFR
jgi:hypothetical protein